jgi:hypothetical protein
MQLKKRHNNKLSTEYLVIYCTKQKPPGRLLKTERMKPTIKMGNEETN